MSQSEPEYPIETERLMLRPFQKDDFDAVYAYRRREDVTRYMLRGAPPEAEYREDFATRMMRVAFSEDDDAIGLAIVVKDTGEVVGDMTLFMRSVEHQNGEIGWIVHPDHQGKGYARESAEAVFDLAFERMGLHRVIARIDARNEPSARLIERLGMRREAHFVRNEWIQGEWTDEVVYALLVEEWRERTGNWTESQGAPYG